MNESLLNKWNDLKKRLANSTFRSRFKLSKKDIAYVHARGCTVILGQAERIVRERLGDAFPANDGKQTPMKGHPVFVAQHAVGACCRGCLSKWHGIPRGRPLSEQEIDYIAVILLCWIKDNSPGQDSAYPTTPDLFDC